MNKLIALLALTAAVAGCQSSGGPLLTPQTAQVQQVTATPVVTQTNIMVQTNVVTVTNGVTHTNEVTETIPILETNTVLQTNTVTVTNGYQVSSTVSNVLSGAEMVNTLSAPVNPFAGLIGTLLGLGGAGLAYYARLKTQQAQQHLSTASTIITAVEGLAPAVGDGVKAAVQAQALKMGTTAAVQATVQAVTANLPSTS